MTRLYERSSTTQISSCLNSLGNCSRTSASLGQKASSRLKRRTTPFHEARDYMMPLRPLSMLYPGSHRNSDESPGLTTSLKPYQLAKQQDQRFCHQHTKNLHDPSPREFKFTNQRQLPPSMISFQSKKDQLTRVRLLRRIYNSGAKSRSIQPSSSLSAHLTFPCCLYCMLPNMLIGSFGESKFWLDILTSSQSLK